MSQQIGSPRIVYHRLCNLYIQTFKFEARNFMFPVTEQRYVEQPSLHAPVSQPFFDPRRALCDFSMTLSLDWSHASRTKEDQEAIEDFSSSDGEG